MMTVPANVTDRGESSVISTHTSDMIELVSGVCKVMLFRKICNNASHPNVATPRVGELNIFAAHMKSGLEVKSKNA